MIRLRRREPIVICRSSSGGGRWDVAVRRKLLSLRSGFSRAELGQVAPAGLDNEVGGRMTMAPKGA